MPKRANPLPTPPHPSTPPPLQTPRSVNQSSYHFVSSRDRSRALSRFKLRRRLSVSTDRLLSSRTTIDNGALKKKKEIGWIEIKKKKTEDWVSSSGADRVQEADFLKRLKKILKHLSVLWARETVQRLSDVSSCQSPGWSPINRADQPLPPAVASVISAVKECVGSPARFFVSSTLCKTFCKRPSGRHVGVV